MKSSQPSRASEAPTRIVELCHRLDPGKQRFRLEVTTRSVAEFIPEYRVPEGDWYVMAEVGICTHVGTHVEAPYHAFKDGTQAADLDVRRLIGPASIVDFTDKRAGDAISRAEMHARGTHVRSGDIVLIRTGLSKFYMTPRYKRPYMEADAADWLVERGAKAFGIDCSGFENHEAQEHEVCHRKLLVRGIPIIEDMNNLDKLRDNRVFFFALPLPIIGLDACWLRPLAVEPLSAGEALAETFLGGGLTWIS